VTPVWVSFSHNVRMTRSCRYGESAFLSVTH